jgi:hypothetical protein
MGIEMDEEAIAEGKHRGAEVDELNVAACAVYDNADRDAG